MEKRHSPPNSTRKVIPEEDSPKYPGELLSEEMIRRPPQNYYVIEMRPLDPPEPIRKEAQKT
jgi:hypothetical protein